MLGADTQEYLLQERARDMNHIQLPACMEEAPEKKNVMEWGKKKQSNIHIKGEILCRGNMKLHVRLHK